MADNYEILLSKLDEFIRKYYKNQLIKGLIYCTAFSIAIYLLFAVAEYYAHFNTVIRTALFYLLLVGNVFYISKYIVLPLLHLYRLGKILSYRQASEIIGKHFALVQDKLLNVLELQMQKNEIQNTGESIALLEAGIQQKINDLKPVPFSSAISFKENKKYLKYAILPVSVLIFLLLSGSNILSESTNRIIHHTTHFEKIAPFEFIIENDKLQVLQNNDFTLKIKVRGAELPDHVMVVTDNFEYKLNKESNSKFSYEFKSIDKDIEFKLSADGFSSQKYLIQALPSPTLLGFEMKLEYPAYTEKKNEIINNTGDMNVPAGTRITWNFKTTQTEQLSIQFSDTTVLLAPLSKDEYVFSKKFLIDSKYKVAAHNVFVKDNDAVSYMVSVTPDSYPVIEVTVTPDSATAMLLYFNGEIQDDYGFSNLLFKYSVTNSKDSTTGKSDTKTRLPYSLKTNRDRFYYQWDLNELQLNPGDEVEYYFEVWDNDAVNGAKVTRSRKMIYKAPTLNEIFENTEKENSELKDELNDALKKSKELQKEIDALNKQLFEKNKAGWEEKKKLENILEKQNELKDKIEQLKKDNSFNNQKQQEFIQNSEQYIEKQKQLEELFNKVFDEDLKKKMEELQKLMDQLDKNKIQDALKEMNVDNKDLEKELDRQLEMFKQLEFEKKLEDINKKLDNIVEKQSELQKETDNKNSDAKELQKKQEELNKDFESLRKDLNELEKKNNELEKPNQLENTDAKEQQIQQEMNKSEQQLNKNDKKNSSKSQQNAKQQMQQLQQQLNKMQQDMQESAAEEDIQSLRQILSNLVQLSFDQEKLMELFSKTRTDNPQFNSLIQQQKKLKDDSKVIEDSLLALSKRVFAIQQTVNKEISAIKNNMNDAVESYVKSIGENIPSIRQQDLSKGSMHQQYAMTSVNNLALMLSESLNQMQQQSQNMRSGTGSCKKPGKGNSPSQSTMRQMQQQINKQLEELKKALEEGKKNNGQKGTKQGQSGTGNSGGTSEQLVKLAAQQEALRKMMQEMMNKMGGNVPGDMKQTVKDMEQTETELVNKMITQETMMRQQKILEKLLDYEKSEKERDLDEKRESKEGKDDKKGNQNQFLEYKLQKQKEAELLKTLPPSLAPFYKGKVTEYFNNFEK